MKRRDRLAVAILGGGLLLAAGLGGWKPRQTPIVDPPAAVRADPIPVSLSPAEMSRWRAREQEKVAALVSGLNVLMIEPEFRRGGLERAADPKRFTECFIQGARLGRLPPQLASIPVVNGELMDGFGRPLWFHARGSDSFDIVSLGPDGRLETEDDVKVSSPPGRAEMLLGGRVH